MLGYSSKEVIGTHYSKYIHPDYVEKVNETKLIMNILYEDQQMINAVMEEIKKINKMKNDIYVY